MRRTKVNEGIDKLPNDRRQQRKQNRRSGILKRIFSRGSASGRNSSSGLISTRRSRRLLGASHTVDAEQTDSPVARQSKESLTSRENTSRPDNAKNKSKGVSKQTRVSIDGDYDNENINPNTNLPKSKETVSNELERNDDAVVWVQAKDQIEPFQLLIPRTPKCETFVVSPHSKIEPVMVEADEARPDGQEENKDEVSYTEDDWISTDESADESNGGLPRVSFEYNSTSSTENDKEAKYCDMWETPVIPVDKSLSSLLDKKESDDVKVHEIPDTPAKDDIRLRESTNPSPAQHRKEDADAFSHRQENAGGNFTNFDENQTSRQGLRSQPEAGESNTALQSTFMHDEDTRKREANEISNKTAAIDSASGPRSFQEGDFVICTCKSKKDHAGMTGHIVEKVQKGEWRVKFIGLQDTVRKREKSLKHLDCNQSPNQSEMPNSTQELPSQLTQTKPRGSLGIGDIITCISNLHHGRKGCITDKRRGCWAVYFFEHGEVAMKKPSSLELVQSASDAKKAHENYAQWMSNTAPTIKSNRTSQIVKDNVSNFKTQSHKKCAPEVMECFKVGHEIRVDGFNYGGEFLGNKRIVSTKITDQEAKENNLLSFIFGHRLRIIEYEFHSRNVVLPETTIIDGDRTYELVASRNVVEVKSLFPTSLKRINCYYILKTSDGVNCIDVEKELLRLADFPSLSATKFAARMELLVSPAIKVKGKHGVYSLPSSIFKYVSNGDHCEGCGFISERMLNYLVPGTSLRPGVAVQGRFLVPSLGLFKGMLMLKQNMDNGCDIELNASMRKAGPSKDDFHSQAGLVVITKRHISIFNSYIHRMLDETIRPPPEKSFKKAIKALSPMILDLWKKMGLPKQMSDEYTLESRTVSGLQHAWVVGVADPSSGKLPPGHIFVSGLHKGGILLDRIFITRAPCLTPTSGRLLPLIQERPTHMSVEEWDSLNRLPFGVVIFADPSPGMGTLPPAVSKGDLDGDLYFICWKQSLVNSLKAEAVVEQPCAPDNEPTCAGPSTERNTQEWFLHGQQAIAELVELGGVQQLIGKLFKLSRDKAHKSELGNADPDAIAFAEAYDSAIDYQKHRRPIYLPSHLHKELPKGLQQYVVAAALP